MPKPIIIKKGYKKQKGLYLPLCLSNRSMTFAFTESCKYDVRGVGNQSNLHKLFGIGLFHLFGSFKTTKTKKWWELHKWLSIRVGWRYNPIEDVFEITDYCYINGIGDRSTTDNVIVKVKAGDVVKCSVYFLKDGLALEINVNRNTTLITKQIAMPMFLCVPFFLRLRAYVELPYETKEYIIIERF